jgi:hypothetical protein
MIYIKIDIKTISSNIFNKMSINSPIKIDWALGITALVELSRTWQNLVE